MKKPMSREQKDLRENSSELSSNSSTNSPSNHFSSKGVNRSRSGRNKRKSRDSQRNSSNNSSYANTLYSSISNYFFTEPTGGRIDLYSSTALNELGAPGQNPYAAPGVMTLLVSPAAGLSRDLSSPLNSAATAMYTFIRHANSGAANYEASDLLMYTLAMADVYSYLMFLVRTYSIAYTYSAENRYVPSALLAASDVSVADVTANLAQFRYAINSLIVRVSQLAVPGTVGVIRDRMTIFQNVYTEGTSIKDQLYMFVPNVFWRIKFPTDVSAKGYELWIKPYHAGSSSATGHTVQQLIEFGQDLIADLLGNEDFNIMSGDILKAYGTSGIFTLPLIPEVMSCTPIFDIAVLEEIHNCDMCPVDWSESKPAVTQDAVEQNTVLLSELTFEAPASVYSTWAEANTAQARIALAYQKIVTTQTGEISNDLIVDSTRFKVAVEPDSTKSGRVVLNMGYQYIVAAQVYFYNYWNNFITNAARCLTFQKSGLNAATFYGVRIVQNSMSLSEDEIKTILYCEAIWSSFQFRPLRHVVTHANNTADFSKQNIIPIGPEGDIGNYATIGVDELKRLINTSLLVNLNSPFIALSGSIGR